MEGEIRTANLINDKYSEGRENSQTLIKYGDYFLSEGWEKHEKTDSWKGRVKYEAPIWGEK